MSQLITIGKLFDRGWETVREQWKATLKWTGGLIGLLVGLSIIGSVMDSMEPFKDMVADNVILVVVMFVFALWFGVALIEALCAYAGVTVARVPRWTKVGRLILLVILMIPLMLVAFLLFIIPGIWLGVMLSFAGMYVVVDGMSPSKAIGASYRLVRGRWWKIYVRELLPKLFFLVCQFLLLAPVLLLGAVFIGSVLTSLFAAYGAAGFAGTGAIRIMTGALGLWGVVFVALLLVAGFGLSLAINVMQYLYVSSNAIELFRSSKETQKA